MAVLPVETRDQKSVFCKIVDDFFNSSTIHGVKYIGTRPWYEKLWWLIVFVISLIICIIQISAIYTKWKETPFIIAVEEKFTSIGEIPFPAITICGRFISNENQTQLNYDDFLDQELLEMDEELLDLFDFASDVCLDDMRLGKFPEKKFDKVRDYVNQFRKSSSMLETAEKMFSVNSTKFMSKCHGTVVGLSGWSCHEKFRKIVTRYGICMTFNMLQKREIVRQNVTILLKRGRNKAFLWNPETGYNRKTQLCFNSGQCLSNIRVFVHHPYDFPWDDGNVLSYSDPFSSPSIVIMPEMIKTPLELRLSIPPDERNCYFDGERNLKFFKIYSKSNCELECLTNITLGECKCVKYWMPRYPGTPICSITEYNCSSYWINFIFNGNTVATVLKNVEESGVPYKCNCFDRCNSVKYFARESKSEKQKSENVAYGSSKTDTDIEMPSNFSAFVDAKQAFFIILKFNFEKSQFLSYKRIVPYNYSDFIANCGGLLGLFMGISLLSLVEIIYFCTFRLIEAIVIAIKGRRQ
ncbi:pickpocket protein 28-like [Culicoides brevitarsis]|uniref:pickpocket protein 28-like n=1 Tax=Culicoides brevitarsis TaxID=469753 RepID=UPI00307B9F00